MAPARTVVAYAKEDEQSHQQQPYDQQWQPHHYGSSGNQESEGRFSSYIKAREVGNGSSSNGAGGNGAAGEGRFAAYIKSKEQAAPANGSSNGHHGSSYGQNGSSSGEGRFAAYIKQRGNGSSN